MGVRSYYYAENAGKQISIILILFSLTCLFNGFWIWSYWSEGSPYPSLWRIIFISCIFLCLYFFVFLKSKTAEKFFHWIGYKKFENIFKNLVCFPLWIALLIFSVSFTLVVQIFFPGIPSYLKIENGKYICKSNGVLPLTVKSDTTTLNGKIALENGNTDLIINEQYQNEYLKEIKVYYLKKSKNWDNKLYAINKGVTYENAYFSISVRIPEFDAPNPVNIIGKIMGVNAVYPVRSGGGFIDVQGPVGSEDIKLIIFPKHMSDQYNNIITNKPKWWHLPIFILSITAMITFSFFISSSKFPDFELGLG